ncbi:hypothetical protein GUJ93_ZPchr0013g36945 [Zizania palustris]|uniref:Uncharacterized protein n=1 Tax=Zizania palustris TaxID=103762 RepID=A0A8J5WY32_ZIZPA|nr:hypothetical protein GUJ93_ZPchr0013g36945 [Zizania palustris]
MCGGVGGSRWRITGGGLVVVLLVCVVLLSSAATAGGARTIGVVVVDGGTGGRTAPGPVVTVRATTPEPPVATSTAATTTATSEQSAPVVDAADPYKDSKRKVPNGPDPIHNSSPHSNSVLQACNIIRANDQQYYSLANHIACTYQDRLN